MNNSKCQNIDHINDNVHHAVTLWLVVPCYNEAAMLPLSMPRFELLMAQMKDDGLISDRSRIVYVDDCSKDSTWAIICKAHESNALHCGLHLGHNVGQQSAMMAGMEASKGEADCVITVDADLQDDISAIREMVVRYREGFEIVYGVRNDRSSDSFFKRTTALAFYKLMGWLGSNTVYNHSEFRLVGSHAINQLSLYTERAVFLRAIIPQLGYPSTTVSYERHRREAGETKYSLSKLVVLAIRGVTTVTVKPIRLVSVFGLLFMLVAFCVACWALWCFYKGYSVSGWVSLILSIWFVGGSILAALGLIGEYIGNIYQDVKQRPRYNITEKCL